jgi:Rad3-related DNA helicase
MEIARAKSRLPFANANAKQHLLTNLKWWDSMQDRLSTISRMTGGDWVVEERAGQRGGARYWTFDPVWPGLYAEKTLFVGIPKVILLSATLRPKTMGLLGVPSSEFNFHEWPRVFPKYRSPVYHLPTVRMNYRTPDADKVKWLERIDQIIESRGPGRKGIIHTVSYDRQRYILEHSRYARWMVANTQDPNSDSAAEIVEKFKSSAAPSILVSPSMGTGWDFPGKECLWQIITKIPFPDSQSKVMKARAAKDQQYLSYLAMQDLVQQCGRGMRYEGDRCESFVVDDSVKWFMQMSKGLAPGWFIVSTIEKLPPLPPELPL